MLGSVAHVAANSVPKVLYAAGMGILLKSSERSCACYDYLMRFNFALREVGVVALLTSLRIDSTANQILHFSSVLSARP